MTDLDWNEILSEAVRKKKKPTKRDALAILRGMVEKGPYAENYAELAAFWLPPRPKLPMDSISWVALAAADKSEVREYLQFVYNDEGTLVATNGHRLHALPDVGKLYPYRYLIPETLSPYTGDPGTYPDWQRVVPDPKEYEKETGNREHIRTTGSSADGAVLPEYMLTLGGHETLVNARYFDQMVWKHTEWLWYQADKMSPIRFDFPDGSYGVIMPKRKT